MRAISRELGISRNTVKKYLDLDVASISAMKEDPSRHKWLDGHKDYLINQLKTYPKLTAVKLRRRLQDKIGEIQVSERSMRRYISNLKQSISVGQYRYYEPIIETVPGVQCQVDAGELRQVMIAGKPHTVYFVVFVLSFSRLMYVSTSLKPIDTSCFINMHDQAFRYFGGITEECVYDQTKLVVVHEQYRELTLNQRFAQYAATVGFNVRACEGFDPESKGKVEAGVKYVKQDCLYGEAFTDESHLQRHVSVWLKSVANVRTHGTTGKQPQTHYDSYERQHMAKYQPFTAIANSSDDASRKVDKTGLISWKSNKYSAPMIWQQSRILVRQSGGELLMLDPSTKEVIAKHQVSLEKGMIIKNNDHYRDKLKSVSDLEQILINKLGTEYGNKISGLLKTAMPDNYGDQLRGAIKIISKYSELPNQLLQEISERQKLTATILAEYINAWYIAQSRGHDYGSNEVQNTPSIPIDLSAYKGISTDHLYEVSA